MPVPDRSRVHDAIVAVADIEDRTLAVRYTQMWLNEAKLAPDAETEIRYLVRAERSLGGALLASAAPVLSLQHAFNLILEARREATD